MYRAGVAAILSQLAREDRLSVVDSMALEAPKTKLLAQKLKGMGLDSVLLVTDTLDSNLELASRNLPNVLVLEAHQADPVSLIRFSKVIFTKAAVSKIEEILA
jgi:large subunit ribosomal protein L4